MKTIPTEKLYRKCHGTLARRALGQISAGILALAGTAVLHAENWETIYEVPTVGSAKAVVSDAAGNLFLAGSMRATTSAPVYAVIMKSSDGGQSWDSDPSTPDVDDPVDAFSGIGSTAAYDGLAAMRVSDGAGGFTDHVVAAGRGSRPVTNQLGAFNANVFIRRSLDAGATWQTLDEYEHPTYENLIGPRIVALDSQGNIYTVIEALEHVVTTRGRNTTTTRVEHWLVRKGTNNADGTVTWQTFDIPFPDTASSVYGYLWQRGIACVGNDVYIVGAGGFTGSSWMVLKGQNGGAGGWTVSELYRLNANGPSEAYAIAADNTGNLYVAGTASQTVTTGKGKSATTTTTNYWIVRKAAPGGTGWQTVDAFALPEGSVVPTSVAVDRFNNVHVCGYGRAGSLPLQSITRKGSGGAWTTTDTFTYLNDGGNTYAFSICADPDGNLFTAGASSLSGYYRNWLVRRSLAP